YWQDDYTLWKRVLEIKPNTLYGLWAMGVLLLDQNRLPEAEEYSRRALELSPDSPRFETNLGVALARQNRNQEALAYLRRSLEQVDNSRTRAGIAYVLAREGRLAEAEE